MSDQRVRRSPYEQGELKPSPQRHVKKKKSSKKSKRSRQLPPEAKVHTRKDDDDDDVQIIEAAGHGEEEGGSLTIKPLQTQVTKMERGHKSKKDKHRPKSHPSNRDSSFPMAQKRDARDVRDAREIVRERKKEREQKEKEVAREISKREARKREESTKERERLERMELERRRERQVREETDKEKDFRQQKRKDDRRQLMDTRRDKVRGDGRPPLDHHRSRSRDGEKHRDRFHPYSPPPARGQEGLSKKESVKGSSMPLGGKSGREGGGEKSLIESDQDTRRVVVDTDGGGGDMGLVSTKRKDRRKDYRDEEEEHLAQAAIDSSKGKESKKRVEEVEEEDDAQEDESEGDSDSDSDSSGSDSSSGEEEESSDEEEEEEDAEEEIEAEENSRQEYVDRTDDGRDKLRSKFDDHSDNDTPEHNISDHTPSDNEFIPDSPEMSDVEEDLEMALPIYLPAIQGCRSVEEFNCLNRIEEGTYGVVYRALDKKTDEIVALKRLKMEKEKEGFPITSLREINTLLKAQHENIVTVREIVVGNNMDKIYIVMDFVEHDLKSLMENMKNPFLVGEVKTLLQQLLRAVRHLHDNWILHRDLKTSNLLLSHKGILKVGDFGLAREYGSPLRNYTPIVVTLWYRAPELLLGCKEYSTLVDMWSVGCIFAEFLLMKALWPGKSEIDQINKIFKDLGTPTEKIWPSLMELPGMKKVNFNENPYNVIRNRFGSQLSDSGFDLLNRFFAYDPKKRISADDALQSKYFKESPLPVDPSMFPTWPARSEQTKKSASSPKPPSGGKAYQKLMDEEENITAGGFHMPSAGKGVMAFSLKF